MAIQLMMITNNELNGAWSDHPEKTVQPQDYMGNGLD
jgi:hypothetical protein